MVYDKKIDNLFVKIALFFIALLFSAQLRANNQIMYLNQGSIDSVFCTETDCFFPGKTPAADDVYIIDQVNWNKSKNLIVSSKGNIVFKGSGKVVSMKDGSIVLKSGMEPGKRKIYDSTVIFEGDSTKIEMLQNGKVEIYYNPLKENKNHKYHNGKSFIFSQHIKANNVGKILNIYMLVNDIQDLQNINRFLSGNYALSQNIDATETRGWNKGKGFQPIKDDSKHMPFSGNFNGNGYVIHGLFINRPDEDNVGLFGECSGFKDSPNSINNLVLYKSDITGDHYVGSLIGEAIHTNVSNLYVADFSVVSKDIAGGIVGISYGITLSPITIVVYEKQKLKLEAYEYAGLIIGSANRSNIKASIVILETSEEESSYKSPREQLENDEAKLPTEPYLGFNNKTTITSGLNILKNNLDITNAINIPVWLFRPSVFKDM